jgi:hypothetical protein
MNMKTKKSGIKTGFTYAEPARMQHHNQSSMDICTSGMF